jgi:ribosomal protein S12 methylthiotransferase accessory factor
MTVCAGISTKLQQIVFSLVDEQCGLLKSLTAIPLEHSEPTIFIYSAETSDVNYVKNHDLTAPKQTFYASGAGLNREQALWSCMGEAVERYSAAIANTDALVYASPANLVGKAIALEKFVWFSDAQYQQYSFICKPSSSQSIHWAQCRNLFDHSELLFPAQLIWLDNSVLKSPAERYITQISTGLAAGGTPEMSELSGLYEVIERDTFTCYWLLKQSPKRLDWRQLPNLNPQISALLATLTTEITLLLLENDFGIPAVLCIQQSYHHEAIALGMCANLELTVAIQKAVVESCHTLNWTLDMKRNGLSAVDAQEVNDFREHVRFYFDKTRFSELDFLLQAPAAPTATYRQTQSEALRNCHDQIGEVLQRLANRGYEAWSIDITRPEFQRLNFVVCRVIIPGLQPLHVGAGMEYRDPKRLIRFCEHMKIPFSGDISTAIHPFP